jgi:hypothetical protein
MLASVTPRQDAFIGADRVLRRVQDDAHDWPLRPEGRVPTPRWLKPTGSVRPESGTDGAVLLYRGADR